jgi:hypothetical protein
MKTCLLLLAIGSVFFGCQDKEVKYRIPEKKAASLGSNLIIQIPGSNSFKMSNGNPADFLSSYLLRITSNSKSCPDFQKHELNEYVGAGVLNFPVNNKCNYQVSFAIGKASEQKSGDDKDDSFDAFYTTDESFNVVTNDFETGDVTIKLHLKITTLGTKIGFTDEWIKDDLAGPHGNDIQPGKSEGCVIGKACTSSPLYDHNTLGKVYIRATN